MAFCWISASLSRCVASLSLIFSYTAVILWQSAIVVQVIILQCIVVAKLQIGLEY